VPRLLLLSSVSTVWMNTMFYKSLRTSVSLFLTLALHDAFADFGFRFPKATDQLWLGQTINITWESKDKYVSIYLLFDDWNSRKINNIPILVVCE
jgi:hypothetical protein